MGSDVCRCIRSRLIREFLACHDMVPLRDKLTNSSSLTLCLLISGTVSLYAVCLLRDFDREPSRELLPEYREFEADL